MKCERCLAELPRQAQFCLRCGAPAPGVAAASTSHTASFAAAAPRPNKRAIIATVACAVVAAVALGALVYRNQLTRRPVSTPGPSGLVTRPVAVGGSTIVQAPAESTPSKLLEATGTGTPEPVDVIDYLRFLKRVEASKKQLIHAQMTDLTAFKALLPVDQLKQFLDFDKEPTPGTADSSKAPVSHLAHTADEIANQWNDLATTFNQKVPPDSCRALHDAYYDHLGKIQGEVVKVYGVLEKVNSASMGSDDGIRAALKDVTAMQGTSGDVDASMHSADQALSAVCATFHLTKDFDIGEGSSSTMFGGSALGGQ